MTCSTSEFMLRNVVVWGGKEVSAYRGLGRDVARPYQLSPKLLTQMWPAAQCTPILYTNEQHVIF